MPYAPHERIVKIEKITLEVSRPRHIGSNARIGAHGSVITDQVVRLHAEGGTIGVGWSHLERPAAQGLLGRPMSELFRPPSGALARGLIVDLPLWDLVARLEGQPLYRYLGARGDREVELYDGSIYIDDLDAGDDETKEIFRDEVQSGNDYGYRNFKIKIGRGARWMPTRAGLERDILVIDTVRAAAGPDAKIMIDANNGATLNIAQEILERCEEARIFWFEEPFPEDPAFNGAFRDFLNERGYSTRVADGEFHPPPDYFDMVERRLIDVVQHDFRAMGLTWWKATAQRIEPWGARCAPHCWGSVIERYAHAHFAASIPHYALLEAAPADLTGVVLDGWSMEGGKLLVPDTPGTGFDLEPEVIEEGVRADGGFRLDL